MELRRVWFIREKPVRYSHGIFAVGHRRTPHGELWKETIEGRTRRHDALDHYMF